MVSCTQSYDALGLPATRTAEDGTVTTVTGDYDYMGRRIFKKVETTVADPETGESTTSVILNHRYLYRGDLQIAALDLTRTTLNALWYILWDPTEPVATRPLAIQTAGSWFVYGWDLTKNVMELYKSNGTIANSYSYAPFGEVTQRGNITNPLQWSSEAYDAELGMVYYNFRFYNPVDGRWTSRDPIGELDGGVNLYIIAANSILNDCDILGHSCFSDCLNDHDYTSLIIDSLLAYMLGGPIPKSWVPALFDVMGYPNLARQARVGIKMGKKTITTIPSTLSVTLRAGGRSLLRTIGRVVSPIAVLMTALDAIIAGYCGWHCFWNDCYNKKTDNMWDRIYNKINEIFRNM